jgi:hypothetical protein
MNTYRLVIGDWSHDGHEKSDIFRFKTNYTREQIIEAYKVAEERSGVSLTSHSGILTDYEDGTIKGEAIDKLKALGVSIEELLKTHDLDDWEGEISVSPDGVARLFLAMVGAVANDFEWEEDHDRSEFINGFWQKDFNHSMGYGVYH